MDKPNRLAQEKSPYLLQHARNPVDWYPWGEAAFAAARARDKPLLISIGYSTCHWCHVMERESFEDPVAAAVMNENLVCVKVDREERPDVDKVYMTAVQAMMGQGGWPLNVFITPDGEAFLGGTYFPPADAHGRPGWITLVKRIGGAWRDAEGRKELVARGRHLMEGLARHMEDPGAAAGVAADVLPAAVQAFQESQDETHGGFGHAPKFPMPVYQHFLLRFHAWKPDEREALDMAVSALGAMARGGIHDLLGGGFARYAVDERWHVPHFEKMLYDNAQIAMNYLDAHQLTGEASFAGTARGVLDYVLRDMTGPGGGFYSAEDADSLPTADAREKTEGAYYVWEEREIERALGPSRAKLFNAFHGVEKEGNVRHDPHGEFPGKNVLFQALTVDQAAGRFGLPPEEAAKELDAARRKLLEVRARRPRPSLDDKVITAWNGLMIQALARGTQVFGDARYAQAAARAAAFLKESLRDPSGGLYRRWREGERAVPAQADDHAYLLLGLVELFETDFDPRWLAWAESLADRLLKDFYDAAHGGFFTTVKGHDPRVRIRAREDADNVEPSAASAAVEGFLRLWAMTGREDLRSAAEKTLTAHGEALRGQPRLMPYMLGALMRSLSPSRQVVIAGEVSSPKSQALLRAVRGRFRPFTAVLFADGGPAQAALDVRRPEMKGMKPVRGEPAAYVCQNFACQAPVTDPGALDALLDR